MAVSILIVSYNTGAVLRRCLQSIDALTTIDHEIIVVDNASRDDSVAMLRAEFPKVRLLTNSKNVGFAVACNQAAELADGDFICLINPDVVLMTDAITALVRTAVAVSDPSVVGGRSINDDGSVDLRSCWAAPSLWSTWCFALGLSHRFPHSTLWNPEAMPAWQRDSAQPVDIVTGYLLLTSRELWGHLGGLDQRFFLYGEDADFSLRAKTVKATPMITPDAVVRHVAGSASSTSAAKRCFLLAGKITFLQKHWSSPRAVVGILLLQLGVGLRAVGDDEWRAVWRQRRTWRRGYASSASGLLTSALLRRSASRENSRQRPPTPQPTGSTQQ